jgi:phosphoserine phosphatase
MGGHTPFQESIATSLALINPTSATVSTVNSKPVRFSKNVEALIKLLQSMNKDVFLISGGFRQVIVVDFVMLYCILTEFIS